MVTVSLTADTITGTRQLRLEVGGDMSAGAVARSIAERMALPDDVAWALRDERAAFLVEDRPIGEQLGREARVTITPRTHLGGDDRAHP
jgi:hypothetical protein